MEREVLLPRGLFDETGARHRTAVLRPLSGREEAAIGAGLGGGRAAALTRLLAACVDRIGGYEAPGRALVAALSRGDRHHLALRLRQDLFGDRVALILRCPNPSCGARADLDLAISQLAVEAPPAAAEHLDVDTPDGAARVREPTGEDDERWEAQEPGADQGLRGAWLWSRLVLDLAGRGAPSVAEWAALPARTRHAIARGLAEATSAPDLTFLAPCPSCAAVIELELDPLGLLLRELRLGSTRLVAEVHCLAWHYGWSEDAILALPRSRRWQYLELVRRQVEGQPLLGGSEWG